MWADENHTILAIVACVVCNALVFWMVALAWIQAMQQQIANAHYRMRISEQVGELLREEENAITDETSIHKEWSI